MNLSISEQKRLVRARLKQTIRALAPLERARAALAACDLLCRQKAWRDAETVALFAPLADEIDVLPLIRRAEEAGKRLALPRYEANRQAYALRILDRPIESLPAGKFGILEPSAEAPELGRNQLDFVLVPGVAFDLRGRRLGRGRGFYDRLLAGVDGIKCGIAFDEQIEPELPAEPHDLSVSCLATPTRWIVPSGGHATS